MSKIEKRIEKLKSGIKGQYGTLGEFCKVHKIGSSTMSVAFANQTETKITEFEHILKESDYVSDKVVTKKMLKQIQDAIKERHGSVRSFSNAYPKFSEQYVSCLLKGEIKRVSSKVEGIKKALAV